MSVFSIVIIGIYAVYMILNFKHDIHMLQQNSYRLPRYWRWLRHKDIGSDWRLVDVALLFLLISTNLIDPRIAAVIAAIVAVVKICLIFRRKFKKPLVFTRRVWRIYCVTALLALGAVVATALCTAGRTDVMLVYSGTIVTLSLMAVISILSWVVVILALIILMPVEKAINRRYINDAKRILRGMPDLKVVGITGSYGKTSTKHYLHRILSEKYETLMTPGSFNTPMGVVRTVREMMKPYTEIFICEMGAKQKGDIREICDIVHPQAGVVTAVGPMHLETFHNIETVQSTKFELVDALPSDGFAVVNNDFEYCANREVENVECIRYAVTNTEDADLWAENIEYSAEGTRFDVVGCDGMRFSLRTRLMGEANISNLLAATAVALKYGVETECIQFAVAAIEQVEHRLSVKQTPGGVTILDDAFNSNPTGSKMALEVLDYFRKAGRRIVITPGMVELGDRQFELNKELGRQVGRHADVAIIVGEYNRDALLEGVHATDFDTENLFTADSFNEAQALLQGMVKRGDTVLYENDLPDSFK